MDIASQKDQCKNHLDQALYPVFLPSFLTVVPPSVILLLIIHIPNIFRQLFLIMPVINKIHIKFKSFQYKKRQNEQCFNHYCTSHNNFHGFILSVFPCSSKLTLISNYGTITELTMTASILFFFVLPVILLCLS